MTMPEFVGLVCVGTWLMLIVGGLASLIDGERMLPPGDD